MIQCRGIGLAVLVSQNPRGVAESTPPDLAPNGLILGSGRGCLMALIESVTQHLLSSSSPGTKPTGIAIDLVISYSNGFSAMGSSFFLLLLFPPFL